MYDFCARYDGTGRPPRGVQAEYLRWLADALTRLDVAAGQVPVGGGKSFLARSIQLATGGAVITPSNPLIDQYRDGYPRANYLKGKAHYGCLHAVPLTCAEWVDELGEKPCPECPYQKCKERARYESTFFNPLSFYYFNLQREGPWPVIVVDEAHQLASMVMLLCQKKFRRSLYQFDDRCMSEVYLVKWMLEQLRKLNKLNSVYINTKDWKKVAEINEEIQTISITLEGLQDDPQNYAIYFEQGTYRNRPETFLHVKPIRPPRKIVRRLLSCDKLVLLSGTLLPTDVEDLAAGRAFDSIDLPSPIPKEARPIFYEPTPFPINWQTEPSKLAAEIEKILERHPGVNTMIHTTYDRSRKLAPHFKRRILVNTPENKAVMIEQFKREGGVFLAAGCAEGLDLKDELCRLNIIPHLITPNLGDPVVKKRIALEDGKRWLALETLKVTIQQAGRSTRHEKDHSRTIIMDPRFPRLVKEYGRFLPQSFTEAIIWRAA